ncbi:MAG: dihydroorotate dehydrogenase electron transfer subunit [Actinomycetota bacterium]
MPPVQVVGEVLAVKRAGAYVSMTLVAPGVAEGARPGQFVAVAIGGQESGLILRRAFSIYAVKERGVYGGTVEFIFSVAGKGTEWLSKLRPHDPVDVVGPLGKPFKLPANPAVCTLVGGGYGSAPLFSLAEILRARGCKVSFVLGAATADKLFGALEAKRISTLVAFTTEDGSQGEQGRVSDVLADLIDKSGADVVYACGPMGMLRAVAEIAEAHGIPSQLAVEEAMACGIGVCMTCVLPVRGDDGLTRMVRTCVEGPVFMGDSIRWDSLGAVPSDCVGAPR